MNEVTCEECRCRVPRWCAQWDGYWLCDDCAAKGWSE